MHRAATFLPVLPRPSHECRWDLTTFADRAHLIPIPRLIGAFPSFCSLPFHPFLPSRLHLILSIFKVAQATRDKLTVGPYTAIDA